MKLISNAFFIALILLATVASASASRDAATTETVRDTIRAYDREVDRVLRQYLDRGEAPTADQVLRIRSIENQLQSMRMISRNQIQLPPLMLSGEIALRDTVNMPGQMIAARARAAGLDLWADNLGNRSFTLATD